MKRFLIGVVLGTAAYFAVRRMLEPDGETRLPAPAWSPTASGPTSPPPPPPAPPQPPAPAAPPPPTLIPTAMAAAEPKELAQHEHEGEATLEPNRARPESAPTAAASTVPAANEPAATPSEITATPVVWVNVDKPNSTYTIHREPGCIHVQRKRETQLKGLGELKTNGGWLPFDSLTAALREYPTGRQCTWGGCWDDPAL